MNGDIRSLSNGNSHEPIYLRVYAELKRQIREGRYPPDSFLPPERELEAQFGVARKTLRQATELLKREGALVSRRGMGTAVVRTPVGKRGGRSAFPALGIVMNDWTMRTPYRTRLLAHLCEEAAAQDFHVSVLTLPRQAGLLREMLAHGAIDGLVSFPFSREAGLDVVASATVPRLLLEVHNTIPGADHAVVNNVPGTIEAVSELVRLGHRHIAYVGGLVLDRHEPSGDLYRLAGDSPERFGAYRTVLEDAGIVFQPDWYREIPFDDGAAKRLVEDWTLRGALPTAVFAFDDTLALFLVRALGRAGVMIPEEISILGYGNIMPEAQSGQLATVEVDYAELARLAVRRIRERIENGGMDGVLLRAPCRFKPGASIAPPRRTVAPIEQPATMKEAR